MGCVQQKSNSSVVPYEPSMGLPFASQSGKNIQANTTVVMGVTEDNQERIFSFDALTQRFKALAVPEGMRIWNYSSIVHLSNKEVMVSGGLSGNASEISNEAYIFDSETSKAIKLPNLSCSRYTHMSIFHKGKLYAIGGREYGEDDDQAIRTHCERFNFHMHKWEKIARLNIARCTGFTFIYKDAIHVCGGLTGKMHRSRAIERYDESNDQWVVLDFKLSRGIECGSLLSGLHFLSPSQAKDKLFIVGGNTEEGAQDTVFVYNLADQTVISTFPLVHPRVLQKSIAYNQKVYVFGGSETDGIEYYDQSTGIWREDTTQCFSTFVNPENIDFFSCSQAPVTIPDIVVAQLPKPSLSVQGSFGPTIQTQSQINRNNSNNNNGLNHQFSGQSQVELSVSPSRIEGISNALDNEELSDITKAKIKEDVIVGKAYLFGTDIDPFILEIDFLNAKVERKCVPLKLRLFQYQAVVAININNTNDKSNINPMSLNNYFVLLGGVQEGMIKTVRYTYLFDPVTFTAKRVEDMLFASYAFATIADGEYVYAIGGKQSRREGQSRSLSISNNINNGNNRSSLESSESSNSNSLVSNSAILPQCQRFNYLTNKWERVGDLNVKRVSAMCTKINSKIYVFGGFKGESEQVRPNEIEVLDTSQSQSLVWQLLNVKFPIGLEGAALLQLQNDELQIFGGRTSQGEIKYISKFTMSFASTELDNKISGQSNQQQEQEQQLGEAKDTPTKGQSSLENDINVNNQSEENPSNQNNNNNNLISKNILGSSVVTGVKLEKINQMLQSRCLHKACQPYKNFVLILGGQLEPLVETINVADNYSSHALSNIPHIDLTVQKIQIALKKLRDTSLKQYAFATL